MSPRPARVRFRISELAHHAGVSKPTIQHYVAQGLLPRPKKTGKTMAYYDVSCVERIRLIKELQSRYLPLSAIRQLLERMDARGGRDRGALTAAGADLGEALAELDPPLTRDDVPAATGLEPEVVLELERIGLVAARSDGDGDAFGAHDAAILRAVGRMSRAGLNRHHGFQAADLLLFRDAVAALLSRELQLFARHAFDRPTGDVARMAGAAALGATDLIAAIHRKLVAELLAAALPQR